MLRPCGSSRQAGDRLQAGTCSATSATTSCRTGDLDAARRHLAESLDIARELNARNSTVIGTFNLGLAEYLAGSPVAAEALFAESLDLARRMGMKRHIAYALIGLALAGHGRADPALVRPAARRGRPGPGGPGPHPQPLEARLADLDRQRLRAAMGDEAFEAEYAAGRTLGPGAGGGCARPQGRRR